jgi:N-acetylmuramoyl-L-alanine amidase
MKNLTSSEWRDKVTDSIVASIRTFFADHSALAAAR